MAIRAIRSGNLAGVMQIDLYEKYYLWLAVKKNQFNIAKYLIDSGKFDVNWANAYGDTALHAAAKIGNVRIIELLLSNGANVNCLNSRHISPLNVAILNYNIKAMNILIANGAQINQYEHITDIKILMLLIANIDVNIVNYNVLSNIIQNCRETFNIDDIYSITKLLIEKKYDINQIVNKRYGTLLHFACRKNNFDLIKLLMTYDQIDLNIQDFKKETPIFNCLSNSQIVDYLIQNGADISIQNEAGNTLMHLCYAYIDTLNILLQYGANFNIRNMSNNTPIFLSVRNPAALDILLKNNISPNILNMSKQLPLHLAVKENQIESVELLLKAGSKINVKDNNGDTPLHFGACNYLIIQLLLKYGATPNFKNSDDDTPLHLAVKENQIESIELLLKAGSKINVKNSDGNTPLHLGAGMRNYDIIKLLLKYGATPNFKNSDGDTPLHLAVKNPACVKLLLDAGANANFKNKSIQTPLHLAVKNPISMEYLIKYTNMESINTIDIFGNTPLIIAVIYKNISSYRLLLDNGADTNILKYSNSILNMAIRFNFDIDMIELLLKSNAKTIINRQNVDGITPLHMAFMHYNNPDIIELLLKYGADLNIKNSVGNTPFHLATMICSSIQMLLDYGGNLYISNNEGYTPEYYARRNSYILGLEIDNYNLSVVKGALDD